LGRVNTPTVDWILLLGTAGLCGIGLTFLHSTAPADLAKQIQWVFIGACMMFAMSLLDYRILVHYAWEFYFVVIVLLLIVLQLPPIRGAQSWIRLPGFSIQPVELMKVALVLVLANHLRFKETQTTLKGLVIPFLITLIPMALILKQPDLGGAILLPPILFSIVYASGARLSHLIYIAFGGIVSAIPMWIFGLKDYQKSRIYAFIYPELYAQREAYQLNQSLIAIGSGGLFGMGLGQGMITSLRLLPDSQNDFIFGVIAEEGGFVAISAVLGCYLLIVLEGLHIARKCREPSGRLIATGISCTIGAQAIINICVVTGLLPTTGITLPLISYGGSSMVVTMAFLGILFNIASSNPLFIGPTAFSLNSEEASK